VFGCLLTSSSSFAWRAMPALITWLTFCFHPPRRRENSICFWHHSYHTTFKTHKIHDGENPIRKKKIDIVEVRSRTDKLRLFLKRWRKESGRGCFFLRVGKSWISLPPNQPGSKNQHSHSFLDLPRFNSLL